MTENRDRKIFEQFLFWCPSFADDPITQWHHQGLNVSPDIICNTVSGRIVGVELTDWIDHKYRTASKSWEKLLTPASKFPGWSIRLNLSRYEYDKKEKTTLQREYEVAITTLLASHGSDHSGSLLSISESELRIAAPTLSKYIRDLYAIKEASVPSLAIIPSLAGRGTSSTIAAVNSLAEILQKKYQNESYRQRRADLNIHELHLLVHYEFSLFSGTPFGYTDMKALASASIESFRSTKTFDKCWLFSLNKFVDSNGRSRLMDVETALLENSAQADERPMFCHQVWPR